MNFQCRRPNHKNWAMIVVLASVASVWAQPPNTDPNRWNPATQGGSTAIAPPQGYSQGSPLTLTWGFMASGTQINDSSFSGFANGNNNLQTRLNSIYGSQAVWQPLFQSVFDRWSSISGMSYQFEANDDGAALTTSGFPDGQLGVRADVRIGGKPLDGNSNVLAYNYFPTAGEMVIDTNDTFFGSAGSPPPSINLTNVVMHEHGHGLGMPHVDSNNAKFLMEPFFDSTFNGPQYHDILVAQRLYGDAREKVMTAGVQGNDAFTRASSLGVLTGSSAISIGNSARTLVVASTATDFVSIDDNTDTDFYSFTVAVGGQLNVLLEALGFTYNVTAQNAGGNVAFNTQTRSDLALALLGTDGTTVLASSNVTGLGGNESVFFNLLTGGTYYIRITGVDNPDALDLDAQFYALTLNFSPVPEPSSIAMVCAAGIFAWRFRNRRRRLAA